MNMLKIIFYVLFPFVGFFGMEAQSVDSIPLDGSIRSGRLANGLTYYLKPISKPHSKLYLNFYVKAGYYQQDPGQLNIPHAVEHLAFRSGKTFPEGIFTSVKLLDSIGMGTFDLGAYTGHYSTTYNFAAPSNNVGALEVGLSWFRDIADGLKLLEKDIDMERGALKQEFLLRQGNKIHEFYAETKLFAKLFPCRKDYSNFFEYHSSFSPTVLRSFYRDWYRPDLMAVSVVGNIADLDDMERRIIRGFSDIPSPKDPRDRVNCDSLYFERLPQFATVIRPRDTLKSVSIDGVDIKLFFRDPMTGNQIHGTRGIQRQIMMELFSNLLNTRFGKVTGSYENGLKIYSGHSLRWNRSPSALMVNITSGGGSEKFGLQKAISVLHQIREEGFLQGEWTRAKEEMLRSLSRTGEKYWVDQIKKHFVYGEALPNNKREGLKKWFTDLSLDEFNALVKSFISLPEDIGIIAPKGHRALSYEGEGVRNWIREAYSLPLGQRKKIEAPTALMDQNEIAKLEEAEIIEDRTMISGMREIVLGNGVKVVLMSYRPSAGINDNKISLHGFSPYGASSFPKEDYFSAINAPDIISNAGVGTMDETRLRHFLDRTDSFSNGLFPYIDYEETGIRGDASFAEIEIMLQLLHLYFTIPNKSQNVFEKWKKDTESNYLHTSYNLVNVDFNNSIREFTGDSSLTRILGRPYLTGTALFNSIKGTDLDTAYSIYLKLFGNPSDFTFMISGEFDVPKILPLIRKYLGNLPVRRDFTKDPAIGHGPKTLPIGPSYTVLPPPPYETKNASYALKYIKNVVRDSLDWTEKIKVEALAAVAEMMLWQLRFDKGYSLYLVGVDGRYNNWTSRFEITFQFNCEPEELAHLEKECKDIVSDIKSGNLREEFFQQGIKRLRTLYNVDKSNGNRQMQNRMYGHYRFGIPWTTPEEKVDFINSLDREDIIGTANRYFDERLQFEFVMGDGSF